MIHTPTDFGPLISSAPIFIVLEMLKVSDINTKITKLIFKCINKTAPVNFHNWFKINHERHGYITRVNINVNDDIKIKYIFIPAVRTTNYGLKQLMVLGSGMHYQLTLKI